MEYLKDFLFDCTEIYQQIVIKMALMRIINVIINSAVMAVFVGNLRRFGSYSFDTVLLYCYKIICRQKYDLELPLMLGHRNNLLKLAYFLTSWIVLVYTIRGVAIKGTLYRPPIIMT